MNPRPSHPKVDANQNQVVKDLRVAGAYVWILSDLGGEILDLLVAKDGWLLPVELKVPGQEKSLTQGERDGIYKLAQANVQAIIATSAEDILWWFEPGLCGHPRLTIRGSGGTWHCWICEGSRK